MMIQLSQGNGGKEMNKLIKQIKSSFPSSAWLHSDNDSAILKTGDNFLGFTTDSYIVDPIFFPGGNIGHIAACGTINDLAVMGIKPLALSLSLIIEEGFPIEDLKKITDSISKISNDTGIPIVTGDTKIMPKGKVDKIIINTSGLGVSDTILDRQPEPKDKIILSGSLGDHAIALLSQRFNFQTSIITDSQPIIDEIQKIKPLIKQAKDPTRGGLASALNDISQKTSTQILIDEQDIPIKKEVKSAVDLLGIDIYSLACEGRFICITSSANAEQVLSTLKQFNPRASIIGEIISTNKPEVILQTRFGKRLLPIPSGNIVPRIC
ncbi:hydrogenase expression/formation protein HypE [Nanoarchaeota archaeon]